MRVIAHTVAGAVLLLGSLGCGRIQYSFQPYHPAGTAVSVEVVVPHKSDQVIGGTVYYRANGYGSYQAVPMDARGEQLWALLPTEQIQPKETVEYYIDVTRDDKLHAIRSPGSPFVVTFLGEVDMLLASLRDKVYASYDHEPVRFVLTAGNHPIDAPRVIYQMPAIPGKVRADMAGDGYRSYQLVIPAYAVHAGTWRYAIELSYEGQTYRLPAHGYRTFHVRPAPHVHSEPADKEATAGAGQR